MTAQPAKKEQEPIPPAQKARTIAHMNADHRADMRHILRHYGAVPPVPASYFSSTTSTTKDGDEEGGSAGAQDQDPLMTDIDLASVTLRLPGGGSAAGSLHRVLFEPPLAGWAERRGRLVDMTRVAREALGVGASSGEDGGDAGEDGGDGGGHGAGAGGSGEEAVVVVVNEYMAPRVPYDLAIFVGVLVYYLSFGLVWMGWVTPGSVSSRVVEAVRFPGGVEGFTWLVETIFVPVVALHLFETWLLERTKLQRYGVKRGSAVWWMWVVSVFIEGAMAFKRFDLVVERLKGKGKKGR